MNDERKPGAATKTRYQTRMRQMAAGILIVGLSISAVVFAIAPAEVEDEQGGVHVISAANSKKYQLELQRIGGKAAVVAAEFNDWFDGLWHGRQLAGTLAVLSLAGALLCLLAAKIPPLDE